MRASRSWFLALPLVLAACGGGAQAEGDSATAAADTTAAAASPAPPPAAPADSAMAGHATQVLVPVAGAPAGLGGDVMVMEQSPGSSVAVTVRGAPANAKLAAHVHTGKCGSDGPAAAPLGDVMVGPDGGGSATTVVNLSPAQLGDGNHYVQVHEPNGTPGAPVLCVDLAPAHGS